MEAIFSQNGDVIDYTAAEAVAFGEVVDLTTRIGVAMVDIPEGGTGTVHVTGVYQIPKATGEITVGQALYWDKEARNLTTTADSNTPAGWAVAPAENEAPDVLIKLLG